MHCWRLVSPGSGTKHVRRHFRQQSNNWAPVQCWYTTIPNCPSVSQETHPVMELELSSPMSCQMGHSIQWHTHLGPWSQARETMRSWKRKLCRSSTVFASFTSISMAIVSHLSQTTDPSRLSWDQWQVSLPLQQLVCSAGHCCCRGTTIPSSFVPLKPMPKQMVCRGFLCPRLLWLNQWNHPWRLCSRCHNCRHFQCHWPSWRELHALTPFWVECTNTPQLCVVARLRWRLHKVGQKSVHYANKCRSYLLWLWPEKPWARVHLDFAGQFMGHTFLIAVDAHSKWPEVVPMTTTTSTHTITILRQMFSAYGLPQQLITDNGPQFSSSEFTTFCAANGIKHVRTSPYHPSSNGLAEQFVQSFKIAMKKSDKDGLSLSHHLAIFLLSYRTTPHATTNVALRMLFLERSIRTRLHLLSPDPGNVVADQQATQKIQHDWCSGAQELHIGQHVMVRDQVGWWYRIQASGTRHLPDWTSTRCPVEVAYWSHQGQKWDSSYFQRGGRSVIWWFRVCCSGDHNSYPRSRSSRRVYRWPCGWFSITGGTTSTIIRDYHLCGELFFVSNQGSYRPWPL